MHRLPSLDGALPQYGRVEAARVSRVGILETGASIRRSWGRMLLLVWHRWRTAWGACLPATARAIFYTGIVRLESRRRPKPNARRRQKQRMPI